MSSDKNGKIIFLFQLFYCHNFNTVAMKFKYGCGAVAERLRHRSREKKVPSTSPAWTSVLR